MARSNGSRRSKNRVSGRSFWSASSGSAGSVAHSGHGGPFKRRHTPVAFYPTPAGVATRVSARRCAVRRWSNRGNATLQPVVISDREGETDDEFHTAPGHPTRVPRMGIGGTNPRIKMRGGPNELVRLVSSLTTSQRQDVSSIGMGGLLGLEVTEMPPQLGHWLVTNFELAMMAIKLGNGRTRQPTGRARTPCMEGGNKTTEGKDNGQGVSHAGVEARRWGEWFRRHFSVIVVSTLIASVSNGYANQKTVPMFRDVERIKDIDWCTYLLRSLVDTHGRWSQGGTRKFTGPLLFLTLLYVDRVVVGPRDVPRTILTLEGWTSDLLKAREAREITEQGFGVGHLEDPPHATTDQAPPSEPLLSDQVALSQGIVHQPSTVDTPQGFTQLLDTTTRDLLCAAARVADMVWENCAQAYGDHNFKRVNEASKLLLEVLQHEPKGTYSTIDQEPHTPHQTSIDREDALWQNPDNIKALERAELAAIRATTGSDMPSFSLGFTQKYPTQGNEDPIPLATQVANRGERSGALPLGVPQNQQPKDDMPSFSLGFTQDYSTQGNEDPIPPATQVANRGERSGALPLGAPQNQKPKDDMPSFSLWFTQDYSTQRNEDPVTPITQVAIRGVHTGVVPLRAPQNQESEVLPVVGIPDRKGKRPLNQDARPLRLCFSPLRGYPTVPIPPIYMVWMWAFNCPNTNRDEVLFRHKQRTANWSHFLTLREGVNVSAAVVDAWSTVLNACEKSRKWGTPSRLFASTATIVGTVVPTIGTRDERIELFKARLWADFQASEHVGSATLDLEGYFYVVSINLKQYKCDILDCSSKQVPNEEKYCDAPVDLFDMLSEYLESKHQLARSIRVRNLRPKRMQMPWRTTTPGADSAVFAMRHMESFTGQPCSSWECGLQKGNREQLNCLRSRFMHNILMAEANECMHEVSTRVWRSLILGNGSTTCAIAVQLTMLEIKGARTSCEWDGGEQYFSDTLLRVCAIRYTMGVHLEGITARVRIGAPHSTRDVIFLA
nr:uncharacterized protein LOC109157732 isoform X2 [Ipomoea trifida]